MKLRNYTSSVPVGQTIANIETMLVQFGAQHIAKKYLPGGEVESLIFSLPVNGQFVPVQLPVRVAEVERALKADRKRGTIPKGQAERTAWKLMADWVHVQLSLIQLGQTVPAEVFLPYIMIDGKRTFYDAVAANGFKQLPLGEAGR